MRGLFTLWLACLSLSCLDSRWEPCDGVNLLCPAGTLCDAAHGRCSESACLNLADGEDCRVEGRGDGQCLGGICGSSPAPRCGDGLVNGAGEECDGVDLNDESCFRLGFYDDTPALHCSADCQFDTTACTGTCGDGVTSRPAESCDPTDADAIVGSCVTSGYGAGLLGCSETCNAVTTDDCMDFGWDVTDLQATLDSRFRGIIDVWGVDGQLVAVLSNRQIRWFNGVKWGNWPGGFPVVPGLPASETGEAIWGTSMSDFWIAMPSGLAHWNGSAWSFVAHANRIVALWGTSSDDIIGVGTENRIHRYDGRTWSTTTVPSGIFLDDVGGSGPDDIYATGYNVVLHFDGASWSRVDVGQRVWATDVTSVWASAPDDVWIVQYWFHPSSGTNSILHFDGVAWQERLQVFAWDPAMIVGRGRNDVWFNFDNSVMHFDGDGFTRVVGTGFDERGLTSPSGMWADRTHVALYGVRAVALWGGAGAFEPGQVDRFRWEDRIAFKDVWGTRSDLWVAVGDDGLTGVAFHGEGAVLDDWANGPYVSTVPEFLRLVAGFDRDDVYAAGAGGTVYHFDGAAWTAVRDPPGGSYTGPLSLQAVGASDLYLLEGGTQSSVLSRFDGSTWTTLPIAEELCVPQSVWAFSPDDIWFLCTGAVGPGGILGHFDGTRSVTADVPEDVVSVWGSGPDDVFALAPPRRVWHFDGSDWESTEVGLESSVFAQVRGRAADDVFVLGETGHMAHFDGRRWGAIAPLRVQSPNGLVRRMEVLPNAVVVAGDMSELHSGLEGLLRTRLWNCRACERDRTNRTDDDCDGVTDEIDVGCERWGP